MNRTIRIAICLVAAGAASGCSTKPRQFSAQVRPLVAAPALAATPPRSEGAVFATCDDFVRSGRTSEFASAAASTGAASAAVLGSAAAVAASGTVGIGATTAGYALTAAIPFVGIAAGIGMNRMIRRGREKGYRKHMTTCMGELGYEVADWTRAAKKQRGTASLVPGAGPVPVAPVPVAEVSAATDSPSEEGQAPATVTPAPTR